MHKYDVPMGISNFYGNDAKQISLSVIKYASSFCSIFRKTIEGSLFAVMLLQMECWRKSKYKIEIAKYYSSIRLTSINVELK